MDWTAAVENNCNALKRLLAMLVAMVGLGERFALLAQQGSSARGPARAETLPRAPAISRSLHRAVLRLLRPAEAAARRLVIVAARSLVVPPACPRQARCVARRKAGGLRDAHPTAMRPPSLSLFDPLRMPRHRRRSSTAVPRISVPGVSAPFPIVVRRPDEPVSAARLLWRLDAIARTLDDLPGGALRFARWRARLAEAGVQAGARNAIGMTRERKPARNRCRRVWPLRPGRPPGRCRRPDHEVHEVLGVVHGLALWVLESPDTS